MWGNQFQGQRNQEYQGEMMKLSVLLLSFSMGLSLYAFDFAPYRTIVCFGDSITHGGFYHMYLQEYLAETDPAHPRRVINRGISGNTVQDLLKRVDKMLKTDNPDLVMIMVGINDLQFTTRFAEKELPFESAVKKYPVFDQFEKTLGNLIDILQRAGVKVVLLGTPPYNESANPKITAELNANMNSSGVKNLQLIEKRLAKRKGAVYIDTYTPMLENLQKNDEAFPRGKKDRVHPSREEHLLIAQTIVGKKYIPGSKKQLAEEYAQIQKRIQQIEENYARIPEACKTTDAQIEFYRRWVSKLKGNDFQYWNRRLPAIIETLKNSEEKLKVLYSEQETAFNRIYQKH